MIDSVDLRLDAASCRVVMPANLLRVPDLSQVAAAGGDVVVTLETGAFTVGITFAGANLPQIHSEGLAEELLATADEIEEFRRAAEQNDASRLLAALGTHPVDVRIRVRNDPITSGVVWAPSTATLLDAITSERWLATANALIRGPEPQADRRRVLVGDAASAVFTCRGLIFYGPQAVVPSLGVPPPPFLVEAKPSPEPFTPQPEGDIPGLEQLHQPLARLVTNLVWWSLADQRIDDSPPKIVLRGVRELTLTLDGPPSSVDVDPAIQLWQWAAAVGDPARHEAIQQAATFAIAGPEDLDDAPVAVLRTARSLYELAQRGAVSEALATRRAARLAAQEASRDAAKAARETAARSVERSVLVVLGLAGAGLARSQDLLADSQAAFIFLLLGVLACFSCVVALMSELAVGREAISTFKADADSYREALSKADVEAIKDSESLSKASGALNTARCLVWIIHGALILAIAVAAVKSDDWKSAQRAKDPAVPTSPTSRPTPSSSATPTATPIKSQTTPPTPRKTPVPRTTRTP